MSKRNQTDRDIASLMKVLASMDGAARQKARKRLVAIGKRSVPSLILALRNRSQAHLRWEAGKALGAIGDARAVPFLVKALEDRDSDVVWVAAEALRTFKKVAWPHLLRSLIKNGAESSSLVQGAHHVFRNQKEEGLDDSLATLRKALESSTVPELVAAAAYEVLMRLSAPKSGAVGH